MIETKEWSVLESGDLVEINGGDTIDTFIDVKFLAEWFSKLFS